MEVILQESKVKRKVRRQLYGGWASLAFTLVLLGLFWFFPALADLLYRGMIFPFIRMAWDYSIGWLPFPLIWLVLLALPVSVLIRIVRARRNDAAVSWVLLSALAGWVSSFFWLWGFHYSCSDVFPAPTATLAHHQLFDLGREVARDASTARMYLVNPFSATPASPEQIRPLVCGELKDQRRSTWGHPGFHYLDDGGLIRRLGISGIYFPYSCEGYSSSTFNAVSGTYIAAHEMMHAYGVAHEGEADYLAWKALRRDTAASSLMRYSADVALLRNIRGLLRRGNDSLWRELVRITGPEVNRDILLMQVEAGAYPELWPDMGRSANDRYLRLMGQEGIQSYDRFVTLAWKDVMGDSVPAVR